MKNHVITGGGGIRLHAVEAGNPKGRPILFIHGFSQCWMSWQRQIESDLAADFRLVAMDIRGHGLSDKPRDAYGDSRLWADDVHAVIRSLDLERPLLSGWSYGPLVILDYIRHYGEESISGSQFVGGVTKLGSEEAAAVLGAEFLGHVPGFFSADAAESAGALGALLTLCFSGELAAHERYLMLGYNLSVPAYVRQGLFSRTIDNDDLLPRLVKPVLVTHGADDGVVHPSVIERQMARIPRREVDLIPNAGHAAFWDDAPAFNRSLRRFALAL
jgi:non-heme chloroperoxidase